MLRIKVQTLRNLLWFANFLVVLAIAALLVRIYVGSRQRGPGRLFAYLPNQRIEAAMKVERGDSGDRADAARDWPLFESTYTLNVTGKEPEPENIPGGEDSAPVEQTVRPIEEVLRVDMMFVAGDQSYARIRYLEDDAAEAAGGAGVDAVAAAPPGVGKRAEARVSQDFMVPGDPLRPPYDKPPYQGKVLAITSQGVRFSWGGEEVLLQPKAFDRSSVEARVLPGLGEEVDEEELARRAEQLRKSRPLGDHGWFIGTDELQMLQERQEEILDEIGVGVAYDRERQRSLLKLTRVPETSLAFQRGFREGDLVLSLNGEPVSSKFSIVNYLKQHPSLSSYRVEIERRGTRIVKAFQVPR